MIRVNLFQLLQWRAWLRAEEKIGRAMRHSSGRSVKAHAARTLGLHARSPRREVLIHLEAAIAACQGAHAPLTATVELTQE